jgi:hypothetical protein
MCCLLGFMKGYFLFMTKMGWITFINYNIYILLYIYWIEYILINNIFLSI